jgi:hypothetical protein
MEPADGKASPKQRVARARIAFIIGAGLLFLVLALDIFRRFSQMTPE